jgi:hypothetical protein
VIDADSYWREIFRSLGDHDSQSVRIIRHASRSPFCPERIEGGCLLYRLPMTYRQDHVECEPGGPDAA